jgi:urease accessory protein
MCVATSPSEVLPIARMHGQVELAFAGGAGRTRLKTLFQKAPLRVLFPLDAGAGASSAVLVTTSGGLAGGDTLAVNIETEEGARAVVTQQAAEKIYRSLGETCRVRIGLRAAAASWLEWLPQETIVFDGARLDRLTRVDVAEDARLLAGEIIVFGRSAHGEQVRNGLLRDGWRVYRGGQLVWADALRLAFDRHGPLSSAACLAGAAAVATLIYAAADARVLLEWAREIVAPLDCDGLRIGVTMVSGLLLVRWLAMDALALRSAFGQCWAAWRARAGDLPPAVPRVWRL